VTSIGDLAFYDCSSLKSVKLLSATPPTISSKTFSSVTGRKFIVPIGTLASYQSATNWSNYASQMEEAEE
ncbi:MAG: hypothetical protein J6P97_05505, partial [Bacteroidales bacterium]|nr:hypothetical protein [Bacteroidales bacterium]